VRVTGAPRQSTTSGRRGSGTSAGTELAGKPPTEIADRIAIQDVITRYATALDQRDWDLLSQVFTSDAVVSYGGSGPATPDATFRGPSRVAANCARSLARYSATQHLLGNSVIATAGDRAEASTYVQATHIALHAAWSEIRTLGGTYHDDLARTGQKWRIRRRWLEITWEEIRSLGPGVPR